jgi:hypothetical protein
LPGIVVASFFGSQPTMTEAQHDGKRVLGNVPRYFQRFSAHVPQTLAKEIERLILLEMIFISQNRQQSNQCSSRAAVFACVCGML